MYQVGDTVVAVGRLAEEDFREPGETWEHAREGDGGTVVAVDCAGWPIVRFQRTGTVTLCDPVLDVRPLLTASH